MTIVKEFYVHPDLDKSVDNYVVANDMIYIGVKGYSIQASNYASPEKTVISQPKDLGIDLSTIFDNHAYHFENLIFIGKSSENSKSLIVELPEYNNPKTDFHPSENELYNIISQSFYHKDERYLIYYLKSGQMNHILIKILCKNGELHQRIEWKFYKINNYKNISLSFSPNGRYIFTCEHENLEIERDIFSSKAQKHQENANNEEQNIIFSYDNSDCPKTQSVGKIFELVMNEETKHFTLELRREVVDFTERYTFDACDLHNPILYNYKVDQNGKDKDGNRIYCPGSFQFCLTDHFELIGTSLEDRVFMYEEIHFEHEFDHILKNYKDNNMNGKKLNITISNGACVVFTTMSIYY